MKRDLAEFFSTSLSHEIFSEVKVVSYYLSEFTNLTSVFCSLWLSSISADPSAQDILINICTKDGESVGVRKIEISIKSMW